MKKEFLSKELRIKKDGIEFAIKFDKPNELKEQLKDYEEVIKIVEEELSISFESKKKIRKDLDGICDYENNQVVFIKTPTSKVKKVALIIYAHGPEGANLEQITLSSGIENPSRNVLTAGNNKKYFRKIKTGVYGLTDEGITFVTDTVLPELSENKE